MSKTELDEAAHELFRHWAGTTSSLNTWENVQSAATAVTSWPEAFQRWYWGTRIADYWKERERARQV